MVHSSHAHLKRFWAAGLPQQQVEQHGAHNRGDHREQNHQQAS
jgi:hypothetical protein